MKDKEHDGMVKITVYTQQQTTFVRVIDNGCGISPERAASICKAPIESALGSGLALYNVNRRLTTMFGDSAALKITSKLEKGTAISFSIPFVEVNSQWNQPSESSLSMMSRTVGMN